MSEDFLLLVVCFAAMFWSSIAVWRLTYMIHSEDGPGHIFDKIRQVFIEYKLAISGPDPVYVKRPKNFVGDIIDCFYCLSVWVAMPVGVGIGIYAGSHSGMIGSIALGVLSWLGSSALAIFMELNRRQLDE